jgi:hypothetical protein
MNYAPDLNSSGKINITTDKGSKGRRGERAKGKMAAGSKQQAAGGQAKRKEAVTREKARKGEGKMAQATGNKQASHEERSDDAN